MNKGEVAVFVSYHGPDYELVKKIKESLEALSDCFDVFVDKIGIRPGDEFRTKIKENLARTMVPYYLHWVSAT
jgi:TIR domain